MSDIASVQISSTRRMRSERLRFVQVGVGCLGAAGGVMLAAIHPSMPLLSLGLLAATLMVAVILTAERSLAFGYVAVVGVSFVLAPLAKGQLPAHASTTWLLIAVWFGGWSLGQYLMDRVWARNQARPVLTPPSGDARACSSVLVVGVVSLACQWILISAGSVGYIAQARGVISTGPLATVASLGPAALAAAYVTARVGAAPVQRRTVTVLLLLLQASTLAATGFKGAGPIYLLTVWLVATRWGPVSRLKPKQIAVGGAAAVVMLVLFNFAAGVRQQAIQAATGSSSGSESGATRSLSLARLDLLVPADAAIRRADSRAAQDAVAVKSQLVAFVPRALWPSKPTSDYGIDIAYVFFDIPKSYRSSSSITWIGDLFVQGGVVLVLAVSVPVSMAFNRLLRWRSRPDPANIALYFIAAQILLTVESPLLIAFATGLRTFGAVVLAMLGARLALQVLWRAGRYRSPA